MSETARRKGYVSTRVLIDAARVLTPTFDDAVVYLTGAQLEVLRNLTQYANRQESYVAEYESGYYLTPDVDDWDDIQAIVADLEETLMGNPNTIWGYKDRWLEQIATVSTGAGTTVASSDPVPEGYVYVLEHFSCSHNGGVARSVTLHMDVGGSNPILYEAPSLPSGDWVIQTTNLTMKEGDKVTWTVYALADTYTARLRMWGHMMVVPA